MGDIRGNRSRRRSAKAGSVRSPFTDRVDMKDMPNAIEGWTNTAVFAATYRVPRHPGSTLLSISRHNAKGGLTWDELQHIKEALLPGRWAVEVFPPEALVQNVANVRHLWVLPEGESSYDLWGMDYMGGPA